LDVFLNFVTMKRRYKSVNRLSGKIAIVTGASSGIGKSIACDLAELGVVVALVARRMQYLEEIKTIIENKGGKALAVQADLSKEGAVSTVVDRVQKELGPISIMINNAARTGMSSIKKMAVHTWKKVIYLNLTVPFEFIHLHYVQIQVLIP
jgi:short-subunit dehydrogenase